MKKILIPTDFSECANAASEYAIQLAKLAKAEVNFLHLQSTPVDWIKLSKEKEEHYPETLHAIGRTKSKLNRWVKKAEMNNVKAESSLVFDAGKEEVLRHLNDRQHDFLVMGSHGIKGLKEQVIGSNAQQMIRNAKVPVLIIKTPVLSPIKNILFVSDFIDVSKKSFHTLTHFADLLKANIDLLFVNTPKKFRETKETSENMDELMAHCSRGGTCTRNVINAASVENGIKDFLIKNNMDMIVICTHGKSGLYQLLSPSIAEKIANHISLPLLSIKL